MKYDDASWHSGGDFPKDSPAEYGGTHIGLLLKWCLLRGWAGQLHLEESAEEVEKVKRGEVSGTAFLFKQCDGKFTDEDLNDEGNAFVGIYYGKDGPYLNDYAMTFADQMYTAPESAHDFRAFSAMVEKRYKEIIGSSKSRPWWKR